MIFYLLLVLLLNVMEAIAGFGSITLGVPILSIFWGAEVSIALFTVTSLFMIFLMVVTQFKKINVREFLIITACIVPIMPVGYLLFAKLRYIEWALRLIIGSLVALVSGREVLRMIRKKEPKELPRWAMYLSLGVGAVIQGMFSMGASLINIYSLSRLKDKTVFRATMAGVWIVTNTISTLYRAFVLNVYTKPILTTIAYALPFVAVAFLVGNYLHHRISNQRFTNLVYIVQLISGLISIASGISMLV